jgi:hypothetical protein
LCLSLVAWPMIVFDNMKQGHPTEL